METKDRDLDGVMERVDGGQGSAELKRALFVACCF